MLDGQQQKRHFPRVSLSVPISYRERGHNQINTTLSKDISLGGIGLVRDSYIAPLTTMDLEIEVLSRVLKPAGRVAWSCRLPHSEQYRFGVEFLELDTEQRHRISEYIAARLPG